MAEKESILIVDDDESTCESLTLIFRNKGYETETAATGQEAIEKAKGRFFNVALLDIKLPDMEGIELLAPLKELHPDIVLIMITAFASLGTAMRALNEGASAYIAKPFSMHEVLTKIGEAVEKQKLVMENGRLYREVQRELAKRKRAEKSLRETNHALMTLSQCNQALVRAREESGLLHEICRILVEVGEYRFAWVGFAEKNEKETVRPVAYAGYEKGYLKKMNLTWAYVGRGCDPTGRAILTGRPCIERNIPNNADHLPWRSEAAKRGYGSAIALPLFADGQPLGALSIYANETDAFSGTQQKLLTELSDNLACGIVSLRVMAQRKRAEENLKSTLRNLQKAVRGTIQLMALATEKRDPYTAGHQRRVADLARAIATEMGLSEEQIDGIYMAGLIHDLGKIAVPVEILSKPGAITETELDLIRTHPQVGHDLLKTIDFPWPIDQIVFQHHEKMNGSGYPSGLSGEEIILEARIMAVADIVEAMTSHRPYHPAYGIDKALEEISTNRGTLYDSQVVDTCLKLFSEERFKFK